jgi:hypothetical protein
MTVAELSRFQEAEEALSVPLAKYVGRWVAVLNHKVIADAPAAAELLVLVKGKKYEAMFEVSGAQRGRLFLLKAWSPRSSAIGGHLIAWTRARSIARL